ncbi:MAG TPA: TIGR04283 family arsenosugar biosynthesis glycosyltransferase [Chryseolinea sp.]|nr:TIGR04283 family arsenosugar biosynthesis glycosyltransferase [Chryseolinea sp.]
MNISVIIPTVNEENLIFRLVESVLATGGLSVVEVIVVDGASTDKTVTEAKKAGAIVLNCPGSSRANQMNLGAKNARGDLLYFLHADVKIPKSFVTDILKAYEEGYQAGCYRFKFDSSKFMLRFNSYCTRFKGIMCRGGDQTLFITKTMFLKLGGFNEYYTIMEDYDLIQRIREHAKFKIIPENVLVSARKYEKNSWLRVQSANFIVFMMFFLKRHPSQMKEAYRKMLNYR